MFFAFFFVCNRIGQILTLIPTMGMLAWFVHGFVEENALTPNSILVLFIVSVLALAWAMFTLFSYHRSSANALFVGFIDLGFVGALIAAVWYLRGIRNADCTNVSQDGDWTYRLGDVTVTGPDYDWTTDKPCAMLKACWVFAIINIILFFFTSFVAFAHGDHLSAYDRKKYTSRSRSHHSSRHSHRSSRSRSGSRYSHRSPHSRRVYV
ncbi:hypothetical protein G7Z17_g3289 [Cylindrodendrum hubeiense]|uniref:MARVEL domain-containing protein n=1 Tax=Cylindrodendrum hubeiense TaxID=595255 RepID=A0A9P5HIA1_9HYPO|nr:hypothetical protein G7Z17_g3289 [Cylindrodendrum hubeiense]